MDTTDILIIAGGLGLVGYAAFSGSSGSSSSSWAGTKYARTTTYDALKTDGHQAWRVPGQYGADEWDSMCGTFDAAFGYDVCNAGWDRLNVNTILSWFKAMNIDPIRNQNLALNYKTDIEHYYKAVLQREWQYVTVGEGLTGVSGIGSCGLEGIGCLG